DAGRYSVIREGSRQAGREGGRRAVKPAAAESRSVGPAVYHDRRLIDVANLDGNEARSSGDFLDPALSALTYVQDVGSVCVGTHWVEYPEKVAAAINAIQFHTDLTIRAHGDACIVVQAEISLQHDLGLITRPDARRPLLVNGHRRVR